MILDCKDGKLEKGRIQNDLLKLQSGMRSHSIEENRREDPHRKNLERFNWAEAAMAFMT